MYIIYQCNFTLRMGKDEVFLLNGIRHSLSEVLDRGPEGAWRMKQVIMSTYGGIGSGYARRGTINMCLIL